MSIDVSIKSAVWKSLLFLTIFAVTIAIFVIPYMTFLDKQLSTVISRLMMDFVSILSVIIASWVMTKYIDKQPFDAIGFQTKNLYRNIGIGILLALFWIAISFFGQYIFGTISRNETIQNINPDFIIYAIAIFLNASTQEILCRGYLFQKIKTNVGTKAAIIITSLIFLLMHGGALQAGIIPSLNVFGAGLIFAIARNKTGQLWMPIALHFVWNFFISSVLFKPISGYDGLQIFQLNGNTLMAGGQNGIEATIVTTITILVILLAEHFLIKTKNNCH